MDIWGRNFAEFADEVVNDIDNIEKEYLEELASKNSGSKTSGK